jgi:hypothetical protein
MKNMPCGINYKQITGETPAPLLNRIAGNLPALFFNALPGNAEPQLGSFFNGGRVFLPAS